MTKTNISTLVNELVNNFGEDILHTNTGGNKMTRHIGSYEVYLMMNDHREESGLKSKKHYHHILSFIKENQEIFEELGMVREDVKGSNGWTVNNYLMNTECMKYWLDTTLTDKKALQEAYEIVGGKYATVYEKVRPEDHFMKQLREVLEELDIELEREFGILNYNVDGYIPDLNIVIEYDDPYHNGNKQTKRDQERQAKITKKTGCTFVRLLSEDTNAKNIGLVIKEVYRKNRG